MASPLLSVHEGVGAEFQTYADLPIVQTFGEPQAEYAAIHKAVAAMDLSHRGILELTGRDRLRFLNNLLSNETWNKQANAGLPAPTGVYAFLLNTKGRIVTDINVLELGDRTWLEVEARMVEPLRQTLDKYLFSEDVKMTNRTDSLHEIMLLGPGAREALTKLASYSDARSAGFSPFFYSADAERAKARTTNEEARGGNEEQNPHPGPLPKGEGEKSLLDLPPLGSAQLRLLGREVIVWRDDPTGMPAYVIACPVELAIDIWQHLTAQPPADGATPEEFFRGLARPVGWAAFNAARIEAARPLFGIDFDESILPAETGQLARAVSFTKGCYLGQEIVARMHARGQVARQLAGIRMDDDALPIAGSKIYDDQQNEIGGITSSTMSPMLSNAAIALGYVKRAFAAPGTAVRVPAEGAIRMAHVVELPFVRRSGG